MQVYKSYFEKNVNPTNLALFIDSYVKRTDLHITRDEATVRKEDSRTLRMPVLNITGALSPHVEDTVTLNGRLDPTNSTWMKVRTLPGSLLTLKPLTSDSILRIRLDLL